MSKIIDFFTGKKEDKNKKSFSYPGSAVNGWRSIIRESFPGAWQQNIEINKDTVLSFHAVYSCITLISNDIGKMNFKIVKKSGSIYKEAKVENINDVLKKPNTYQNQIQFRVNWLMSKLSHGNTYILKKRDGRGNIKELIILDPNKVTPLVSSTGDVFYKVSSDNLADITEENTFPQRDVIHDRYSPVFHPLIGTSPIFACGLAATHGLNIQKNSTLFFANNSQPGGILTAPGEIADETALRLKQYWESEYSGNKVGKIAVLGDGLSYSALSVTATDAQLIEQLKWTSETVASCFHVPGHLVGIGPAPSYNNIESLNLQYYTQCLQILIEEMEACLDDGLELPENHFIELNMKSLTRMDTSTRYKTYTDAIGAGWMMPNEARQEEDLEPVEGGDAAYMQQQNYSLEALSKRDKTNPLQVQTNNEPVKQEDNKEQEKEEQKKEDEEDNQKDFKEILIKSLIETLEK